MEFTINFAGGYEWHVFAYDKMCLNQFTIQRIYRNPNERYLQLSITHDKISMVFDVQEYSGKLRSLKVNQKIKLVYHEVGGFRLDLGDGQESIHLGKPDVTAASVWHSSVYEGDLKQPYNDWLVRYFE